MRWVVVLEFFYDRSNNLLLHFLNLETLRMYPPLPFLDRLCQLPKGQKGYSLEPYGDFEIPDNMPVLIPFLSIHRDPKVQTIKIN